MGRKYPVCLHLKLRWDVCSLWQNMDISWFLLLDLLKSWLHERLTFCILTQRERKRRTLRVMTTTNGSECSEISRQVLTAWCSGKHHGVSEAESLKIFSQLTQAMSAVSYQPANSFKCQLHFLRSWGIWICELSVSSEKTWHSARIYDLLPSVQAGPRQRRHKFFHDLERITFLGACIRKELTLDWQNLETGTNTSRLDVTFSILWKFCAFFFRSPYGKWCVKLFQFQLNRYGNLKALPCPAITLRDKWKQALGACVSFPRCASH